MVAFLPTLEAYISVTHAPSSLSKVIIILIVATSPLISWITILTALRTVACAVADFAAIKTSHLSSVVLVILAGRIGVVLIKVIAMSLGIIRASIVNFISSELSQTWSVF